MGLSRHIRNVLLAFTAVLQTQCVKDSLDGCEYESGVVLRLKYTDAEGRDIMPEMLGEAAVYIFDQINELATGRHMDKTALAGEAEADFVLPPGEYYALAWGNKPYTEHVAGGKVTIEQLYVPMVDGAGYHYAPRQSIGQSSYNFMEFTVPENGKVRRELEFMPVYLSVNIWIYGLEREEGDIDLPLRVEMTKVPHGFDFFLEEIHDRYKREKKSENILSPEKENAEYAGFILPYFYPGSENALIIYPDAGVTPLVSVDLHEFISDNGLEPVPGDSLEIYIRFSGKVVVDIGIPAWSNKPVIPQT